MKGLPTSDAPWTKICVTRCFLFAGFSTRAGGGRSNWVFDLVLMMQDLPNVATKSTRTFAALVYKLLAHPNLLLNLSDSDTGYVRFSAYNAK
jgi:hypothetical protein